MCFALRNTLMRGRSEVPFILLRMRSFLRSRPTIRIAIVVVSYSLRVTRAACTCTGARDEQSSLAAARLRRLAGFLADLLALVAHTLAAVGLRGPEAADLRGGLP